MKRLRYFILTLFVVLANSMSAQNVSDVSFYQEGKNIVVTYSLDKVANVSVQVSTDGGVTYSAPLKHVSGDVGKGVAAGAKQIVWDVLSEYDSFTGDNVMFLVTAVGAALNGHDYVDLGLPSGLLWATCNVGATKPEEYGDYFAWGETAPKEVYNNTAYKYYRNSGIKIVTTKYCTRAVDGRIDNKTTLEASDDAANVNWGGNWRMPTETELNELRENCEWELTTHNEIKGFRITGKNGNSIFLPYAGFANGINFFNIGKEACYWSSTLNTGFGAGGTASCIRSTGRRIIVDFSGRSFGHSVRPVCSPY